MPGLSTSLKVAALLIGFGIPALVAHTLYRQHAQALASAETHAANTARALEQHAARTVESIDAYLRAVVSLVGPRAGDMAPEVIHAALREQLARSRHLNNLMVIDRNGRAIFEADAFPARPLDVSDRDYFQILRNTPGAGLVVGRVIVGRLTGKRVLPVARRMEDLDGSFAGVVQAVLDPAAFQAAYDAIDNGPGATLSLWRGDGTLLVRSPQMLEVIGKNYASGENYKRHVLPKDTKPFWAVGSTDGVERVIAFGFLDGYPLYVSAALGRADVLAEWRRSAITQASVAGGLTLVLVLALLLLAREMERRQVADATIRMSEANYRLLAENTTDVIVWSDLNTTRRYVSPAARNVLGYEADELVGTRPLDFVHPNDVEAYRHILNDVTQGRAEQALTCQRYRRKDGRWVWIEVSFKLTRAPDGVATGYVASLRDITARKAAEDALRLSEERLALALDSGSDGLWDWDLATGAVELSTNWFAMLGYEPSEIEPHIRTWEHLVHPEDAERSRRLLSDHLRGLIPAYECEYRLRRKSGDYAWTLARGKVVGRDENGRALRVVGTHIDITRRKEAERQVAHMAVHDALTGLPNRVLFRDRIDQELAKTRRHGRGFAVLACDLDRFKAVNDSLGHPAGDTLLRSVAERLTSVIDDDGTIARLGGDEFAVILGGVEHPRKASLAAQRIIEALSRPFDLDGRAASVGVSIGVAVGPQDGGDADHLFKNADIALYRAKAAGRNTFCFFEPGMDAAVAARPLLELDMRDAIERGGFVLNYQPIVNLATGLTGGFEALMRWQHPLRGPISPAEFIPLAEETGLIVALGTWALREACREATSWPDDLHVAVNVSTVQFARPGLEQSVVTALSASGLPPHRLELEITESVLMGDADSAVMCLHRLRSLGVRIALDDFGTGYSSLSYLRRFPFDKIKIDRSFVRDIGNPDTAAIVRAIVGIGERLGAAITAEGVETDEQLGQVRREGCTEVQGYLFSKPLSAPDALAFACGPKRKAA